MANIRQQKTTSDSLKPKMEAAVLALLSHATIAEAAAAVGIHEVTLGRWLKQPAFQIAYQAARRETVSHALDGVQRAASEAINVLRAVMKDTTAPAASRVSAARAVLDTAIKSVEVEDLMARLEALEATLPDRGKEDTWAR